MNYKPGQFRAADGAGKEETGGRNISDVAPFSGPVFVRKQKIGRMTCLDKGGAA